MLYVQQFVVIKVIALYYSAVVLIALHADPQLLLHVLLKEPGHQILALVLVLMDYIPYMDTAIQQQTYAHLLQHMIHANINVLPGEILAEHKNVVS